MASSRSRHQRTPRRVQRSSRGLSPRTAATAPASGRSARAIVSLRAVERAATSPPRKHNQRKHAPPIWSTLKPVIDPLQGNPEWRRYEGSARDTARQNIPQRPTRSHEIDAPCGANVLEAGTVAREKHPWKRSVRSREGTAARELPLRRVGIERLVVEGAIYPSRPRRHPRFDGDQLPARSDRARCFVEKAGDVR